MSTVIKVGGQELDNPDFMRSLARHVAAMDARPVIVHGGGRASTDLAARLGLQTHFVNGQRVTDEATLEVVVMGLVGLASTQLVRALVDAGLKAVGLCGVDARIVTVRRMANRTLGWVGEPVAVDATALRALLAAGFLPCIAPPALDEDGHLYNVNADSVAAAVASALQAQSLDFVTAAPGVLHNGEVIPRLTAARCESLIADGTIRDGMIPKVRAACGALAGGVRRALIIDIAGLKARPCAPNGAHHGTEVVSDDVVG